jgi:hypothetical protein
VGTRGLEPQHRQARAECCRWQDRRSQKVSAFFASSAVNVFWRGSLETPGCRRSTRPGPGRAVSAAGPSSRKTPDRDGGRHPWQRRLAQAPGQVGSARVARTGLPPVGASSPLAPESTRRDGRSASCEPIRPRPGPSGVAGLQAAPAPEDRRDTERRHVPLAGGLPSSGPNARGHPFESVDNSCGAASAQTTASSPSTT